MNLLKEIWKTLFSAERMANRSAYETGPSLTARKSRVPRMEEALDYAMTGRGDPLDRRPGFYYYQQAVKRKETRARPAWEVNCRCTAQPIINITGNQE